MTRVRVFEIALFAFPLRFRSKYAPEMLDVFQQRSADLSITATLGEILNALLVGGRMRLSEARVSHRAAVVTLAGAMGVTLFAIRDAGPVRRFDFTAQDPAGAFTITVIDGVALSATVDRVPVPSSRIISEPDSIKLLSPSGNVAVAVGFNARGGQITWEPRSRR